MLRISRQQIALNKSSLRAPNEPSYHVSCSSYGWNSFSSTLNKVSVFCQQNINTAARHMTLIITTWLIGWLRTDRRTTDKATDRLIFYAARLSVSFMIWKKNMVLLLAACLPACLLLRCHKIPTNWLRNDSQMGNAFVIRFSWTIAQPTELTELLIETTDVWKLLGIFPTILLSRRRHKHVRNECLGARESGREVYLILSARTHL